VVLAVVPLAADAAFYVVFGAAAIAFVVLSVITVGWAYRQDRIGRQRWLERRQTGDGAPEEAPPATNGHRPARRPGPSGRSPE
jgi:hypothetical protein